jgi:hypothetical protein
MTAVQRLLEWRSKTSGDASRGLGLGAETDTIAKLIIRSYASAQSEQAEAEALDVLDQMMALSHSPMTGHVSAYE